MENHPSFTQSIWNLEDLFPSHESSEFLATKNQLAEKVKLFESYRDQLKIDISSDVFFRILQALETITELAQRIHGYSGLWFSQDTQNQNAIAFRQQIHQFLAQVQNQTLFFSIWWKSLEEPRAKSLMEKSKEYCYYLEEMRHFKPHTLSEPEEKIVNIKNVTGVQALETLYDIITNRYTFKLVVDGTVKEHTRGELMTYVSTDNPDLRARAYQELYRVYGEDAPILGQMYQTVVQDWRSERIEMRKFSSPIAARNLTNDVPDDVVDTLMDVSRKNAHIFQRFFKIKARWLGMDRLRRYDIYAPVGNSGKQYLYPKAVDFVLDSFENFHPSFANHALRIFEDHHIDSEIRKRKDSGAFCWTVTPQLTPWVMVNYQGRLNDVTTLAHELGHAIHGMLSSHHNVFINHATLPLSETASTFGEMVVIDRLLDEETDDLVRRDILFRQVDDAYATIMRQAFFAMFERQAHETIHQGITTNELAELYLKNLSSQFGSSVDVSPEFQWEWVSIPHFYMTPFYVYAYSFGQLLVLSLYQQYKKEGDPFKDRYIRILKAGGSDSPIRILGDAGIDVHSAEFWQGGFDVIARMVDDLDQLSVPPKR